LAMATGTIWRENQPVHHKGFCGHGSNAPAGVAPGSKLSELPFGVVNSRQARVPAMNLNHLDQLTNHMNTVFHLHFVHVYSYRAAFAGCLRDLPLI
jgi:hypothetical protein